MQIYLDSVSGCCNFCEKQGKTLPFTRISDICFLDRPAKRLDKLHCHKFLSLFVSQLPCHSISFYPTKFDLRTHVDDVDVVDFFQVVFHVQLAEP